MNNRETRQMVDNNNIEFKQVQTLQKAELHIHLEGAIDLKTIKKIARRKKMAEHPVRRLFDQGVQITINTDDPALFQVSLSDQYRILTDHFSFNSDEIATVVKNCFTYSFRDRNR